MDSFSVNTEALKSEVQNFALYASDLQNQNNSLQSVIDSDFASGPAYAIINTRLKAISHDISEEKSLLDQHHAALMLIATAYEQTENDVFSVMNGNKFAISYKSLGAANASAAYSSSYSPTGFNLFKDGSLQRLLQGLYELGIIAAPDMLLLLKALLFGTPSEISDAWNSLITAVITEGQADLRALIPRYVSNEAVVALYEALRTGDAGGNNFLQFLVDQYGNTLTPQEIEDHYNANCQTLLDTNIFEPGKYIENQYYWDLVEFGSDTVYPPLDALLGPSSMKQSGCEIIAVANALHAMGHDLTPAEMAGLIRQFENDGMCLDGEIGTSPIALADYLTSQGYKVGSTTSNDPAIISDYSDNYDTFIVTAYNDNNDVTQMIHTVSITKNPDGTFVIHNGYRIDNGAYVESQPYNSLEEAIENIHDGGNSESIMITGISENMRATNGPSLDAIK